MSAATNIEDAYPLSPTQEGMLFHSLYDANAGLYVPQVACVLQNLNVPAFERAWQRVMDHHPVLRAAFAWKNLEKPLQVVGRHVELPLLKQDWRDLSIDEQQERFQAYLLADRRRGFKLSKAPLTRLALFQVAADTHKFVWSVHHLLLDGWSQSILLQQVLTLYQGFARGEDRQLEKSRPYRDYITWLQRQDLSEAEAFWRQTLKGFTTPTSIRVGRSTNGIAEHQERFHEQQLSLSSATTEALQSTARQHHLTMNTLVQGAWAVLLSRYSGTNDVVFGVTVSGRPPSLAGSEFMIGMFINTLPVRVRIKAGDLLVPWLQRLQEHQLDLRQYEYSPLIQIQGWSEIPRGRSSFESIVVFENYPVSTSLQQSKAGDKSLTIRQVHSVENTNYPLTVVAVMEGSELVLQIGYDTTIFDGPTIRRMSTHLQTLLEGMATNPAQRVLDLPMLTAEERRQILVEWNETATRYGLPCCFHQRFAGQAERTPAALAVVCEQERLSYRELNERANQLAHYLQRQGIGPESLVGVLMERSVELVVALLAVLKAGAAYVPLDPGYPAERLSFMIEDARVRLLLTAQDLDERVRVAAEVPVLKVANARAQFAAESSEEVQSDVGAENLAYVIYTSGSTGTPKGAMITHGGLLNYLQWASEAYQVGAAEQGAPLHSPLSFDLTVTSLFGPLLVGQSVVLLKAGETLSELAGTLRGPSRFAMVKVTPAHLEVLAELLGTELGVGQAAAQVLVIGGEALRSAALPYWRERQPQLRLINEYGPTETVVGCCVYEVGAEPGTAEAVPIGKPIANTELYILDPEGEPVPVGVSGELHIGGVGLARGYLRRPELTAERFIPHPYSGAAGVRLYRTGDIARYLEDGNIEYLGRGDTQVKVRGYRIELGEIEAVLGKQAGVRQSAVLVRADGAGEKQLVAYVVATAAAKLEVSELRHALKEQLPDYMIPAAFVLLDELPLTDNGKIDRRKLADSVGMRLGLEGGSVAPRDTLELQLVQLWEEILDARPIGVTDNFFELGGHSLISLRLMARIQKRFGRELPLSSLFHGATIEHLAGLLRQDSVSSWSTLVPIQPHGSKPPFFCIHPIGGEVLCYYHLAQHMGVDQPFYALQAHNVAEEPDRYVSIEKLAADYLEIVRGVQADGPYLLGGWSFGGVVAFEMAQQLRRQGKDVSLLALFDTWSPEKLPKVDDQMLLAALARDYARANGGILTLPVEALDGMTGDEQLNYVLDLLKKAQLVSAELDLGLFGRYFKGWKARNQAIRNFGPQSYDGAISLYRASEINQETSRSLGEPGFDVEDATLGWAEHCTQPVNVQMVAGYHETMLDEPHVQALAQHLINCIAEKETSSRL